jgi:hypothetical protein
LAQIKHSSTAIESRWFLGKQRHRQISTRKENNLKFGEAFLG